MDRKKKIFVQVITLGFFKILEETNDTETTARGGIGEKGGGVIEIEGIHAIHINCT